MSTFECIKTYVAGQHWDEQLGQNVQFKYAAEEPKPPRDLGDVQADMRTAAGDELDRLARQRMTALPGETYRQAFGHVLADNPDLKQKYIKGE